MAAKYISKFYQLDNNIRAGKWISDHDPRRYQPPPGYSASAELVDIHPGTQQYLEQSQWWLFLVPMTINTIMTDVYLSKLTQAGALQQLMALDKHILAETILDCFHRGECRALFCNVDGEPH